MALRFLACARLSLQSVGADHRPVDDDIIHPSLSFPVRLQRQAIKPSVLVPLYPTFIITPPTPPLIHQIYHLQHYPNPPHLQQPHTKSCRPLPPQTPSSPPPSAPQSFSAASVPPTSLVCLSIPLPQVPHIDPIPSVLPCHKHAPRPLPLGCQLLARPRPHPLQPPQTSLPSSPHNLLHLRNLLRLHRAIPAHHARDQHPPRLNHPIT